IAPKVQAVRVYYGSGNSYLDLMSTSRSVLPWTKITAVQIVFNEDMLVAANDLSLGGRRVSDYLAGGTFGYDAARRAATWHLGTPLSDDRFTIILDGPNDVSSNALSGWSKTM